MSARSKGKAIEFAWCKLLLKNGFIINRAAPGTKWNRNTDLWDGRFDVEAIAPKSDMMMHFFQIATRWKTGADRRHLETFPLSTTRRVYMVRKKDHEDFEIMERSPMEDSEWAKPASSLVFFARWGLKA